MKPLGPSLLVSVLVLARNSPVLFVTRLQTLPTPFLPLLLIFYASFPRLRRLGPIFFALQEFHSQFRQSTSFTLAPYSHETNILL